MENRKHTNITGQHHEYEIIVQVRVQDTGDTSSITFIKVFVFSSILAALSRNYKTWFVIAFAPRWQSSPG